MSLPDLEEMFRLDASALELFLRASIIYLGLLFVLRIMGRREMGSLELPELLMIVLIADGVQNGLGDYASVTGAAVIAATLIGWNFVLDWLAYKSDLARRLLRPAPLLLVRDGAYQRKNMRREMLTRDELDSLLRAQGIDDISAVRRACLEPHGELSVIKTDGDEPQGSKGRRKTPLG